MSSIQYLNAGVVHASQEYQASGPRRSPRIVLDLLALAHLCRDDDTWRTIHVTEQELKDALQCIPDPTTPTEELLPKSLGTVFLLPRLVNIGKGQSIGHVAIGHAPGGGEPISGVTPAFAFSQDILIYGAANEKGVLCGFVNMVDQPTIGQIRLLPGSSWIDLRENWTRELDHDEIVPDAHVLALGISFLLGLRGRI
jgi:hypothetical protein